MRRASLRFCVCRHVGSFGTNAITNLMSMKRHQTRGIRRQSILMHCDVQGEYVGVQCPFELWEETQRATAWITNFVKIKWYSMRKKNIKNIKQQLTKNQRGPLGKPKKPARNFTGAGTNFFAGPQ